MAPSLPQPCRDQPARIDAALFTPRFWLACSVHFTGAMASSLYILFPLFIRQLGGSELTIGLYAGLTGAAAVAARIPVGRFLDSHGPRRVLIVAGCLHTATWLAFLSIGSLGMRSAALVVAYGVASGSLFASYFTYASDITPVTRRSEGFAMFGIWGMLPNGLGPLLGEALIAHASFHIYLMVAAAFACTSLCLCLLLPETVVADAAAAGHTASSGGTFPDRAFIFLLATTFMFGAGVNSLYTFLAPFTYASGRDGVGSFFMSYAVTAVAVRVLTGRMPDRVGLRRVLLPALLLYATGLFLVPRVGHARVLLVVGAMCGAGHGYAFPILSALAVELVPPSLRGRAVSWLTAMFDLGNTLANPMLGAVAEWAGYPAMFTSSAVGVLAGTALLWRQRSTARRQSGRS